MKAQRRHDLKDNTLARGLYQIPSFTSKYGARIALVLVAAAVLGLLIGRRISDTRQTTVKVAEQMVIARQALDRLRTVTLLSSAPELFASQRDEIAKQAFDSITYVIDNAPDRRVEAEALIARGDLNWILANLPIPPAATTRPTLAPGRDTAEYLSDAEASYRRVLEQYRNEYSLGAVSAYFGLAAIAQNRQDWDRARSYLEEGIRKDSSLGFAFQRQAMNQISTIDLVARAPIIGKAATQTASPAIAPTTAEAGKPAVAPAKR